jgi:hypothetical protein
MRTATEARTELRDGAVFRHRLSRMRRAVVPHRADSNLECQEYGIVVGSLDMEERLVEYVAAGVLASSTFRAVSLATDGATPAGMHLQNSVLVFANNLAIMCCPVVAGGFPKSSESQASAGSSVNVCACRARAFLRFRL